MEFSVGVSVDLSGKRQTEVLTALNAKFTNRVDPDLWSRLVAWRTSPEGAAFVMNLDDKLSLKPDSARRLADEYIRFLALCLGTDEVLAPSAIVDEAWHLHLLSTRAYFEDFCPNVLGRTLHHTPGRPSPDRDPAYDRTKANYLETFGHPPPADIWPDAAGHRLIRASDRAGKVVVFVFMIPFLAGGLHQIGILSEEAATIAFLAAFVAIFLGIAGSLLFFGNLPMRKNERSSGSDGGDGCGGD